MKNSPSYSSPSLSTPGLSLPPIPIMTLELTHEEEEIIQCARTQNTPPLLPQNTIPAERFAQRRGQKRPSTYFHLSCKRQF